MNNKITELYWKCNKVQGDYSTGGTQVLDVEKFAKLIIQECIKSVEELYIPPNDIRNSKDYGYAQWWEGYDDRGSDSTDAIKKRFGVE